MARQRTPGKRASKKATGQNSPAMQQYFRCKEQYPDALLFFRMGDFYEMFFEDAVVGAELLDIALTSRSKTTEGVQIPMAGVPHHAAASYVARLLERGRKVAICEQMADPATVKGVVPREVVRVVTPGLCMEPDALDARAHNYVAVVVQGTGAYGLSAFELSTGELRACELPGSADVLAELVRLDPRELLVGDAEIRPALERALAQTVVAPLAYEVRDSFDDLLEGALGEEEGARATELVAPLARWAAAEALAYAQAAHPGVSLAAGGLHGYDPATGLVLDEAAVRNLELVRTLSGERSGSLLGVVDETRSALGARELRRRIVAPLCDVAAIRRRHDMVEALVEAPATRDSVRTALGRVGDLDRLATRAQFAMATPRDLGAIRDGLSACAELSLHLGEHGAALGHPLRLAQPDDLCDDVHGWLRDRLVEQPPHSPNDGSVFREGFDSDLDALRRMSATSKELILDLERRERARTGIASLKVRYTKVFGYYIEVTKAKVSSVPTDFRRKQTVANAERYTTDELDELHARIADSDDRARALDGRLFAELRERVGTEGGRLRVLAARVASLDVDASWAEVAHRYGYVRPVVDDSTAMELTDARHPIVERTVEAGRFVPNDVELDTNGTHLIMVTGPNMAGKSTVMRQVALATIMAQCGGFVAAAAARIGLVDRVFTRVGASDNLGEGLSTFMVEMRETSTILRAATRRSLVVLDEVGRGTSTYDGLAIAWAVAEHLHDRVGCRTLFATHYHELCDLATSRPGIANFNVAAREHKGDVVFLRKLVAGGTNRSYGVAVARLAGVPDAVLGRARSILAELERARVPMGEGSQMALFDRPPPRRQPSEVEAALAALDLDRLRPIDALAMLASLQEKLAGDPSEE